MPPTTIEVKLTDGRALSATVKVYDLIAFERQYDKPVSALNDRLEYSTFIGWSALSRQGDISESFEDFLRIVEVGADEAPEAEAEDPKD